MTSGFIFRSNNLKRKTEQEESSGYFRTNVNVSSELSVHLLPFTLPVCNLFNGEGFSAGDPAAVGVSCTSTFRVRVIPAAGYYQSACWVLYW